MWYTCCKLAHIKILQTFWLTLVSMLFLIYFGTSVQSKNNSLYPITLAYDESKNNNFIKYNPNITSWWCDESFFVWVKKKSYLVWENFTLLLNESTVKAIILCPLNTSSGLLFIRY